MKRLTSVAILLAVITWILYLPVKDCKFLLYDDEKYVTANQNVTSGLSLDNIEWAFTTGRAANYHPLTWISHQLDCQLFGLNPGPHHLVNVAIHCLNSVLLLLLLAKLTRRFWRSVIIAALFAWHPMHVESVAWVAERKDVLSTLFMILTILAYSSFVKNRTGPKYLLLLVLFALALLAKPMAVTLPFILLLLDFWPLERVRTLQSAGDGSDVRLPLQALVMEKVPLLFLSFLDSIATFLAQQKGGTMSPDTLSLAVRFQNAFMGYANYVIKLFWPLNLVVLYPLNFHPGIIRFAVSLVFILLLTALVLRSCKTNKAACVGWFWFLGSLVPVIGLVQVGAQGMADRYTYFPGMGLFVAVVWCIADLAEGSRVRQILCAMVALFALASCLVLTRNQIKYWRDDGELFKHQVQLVGPNTMGEFTLALFYERTGQYAEAIPHYAELVHLAPSPFVTYTKMGECLQKLGRHSEAITHFEKALSLQPNFPETQLGLAGSLEATGKMAEAETHFKEAVRLNPGDAMAHYKLGLHYQANGDFSSAKGELEEARRIAYLEPDIVFAIGRLYFQQGMKKEAAENYEACLKLNADNVVVLNDLAWIRAASADASLRNGEQAIRLARRACELTKNAQPYLLGTLANAYAESGRFNEAIATAREAISTATAEKLEAVAARNRELVEIYQSGRAFHENQ